MTRYGVILAVVLFAASPSRGGELDREYGVKSPVAIAPAIPTPSGFPIRLADRKAGELDAESFTQSHHGGFGGGFHHGGFGGYGGYRGFGGYGGYGRFGGYGGYGYGFGFPLYTGFGFGFGGLGLGGFGLYGGYGGLGYGGYGGYGGFGGYGFAYRPVGYGYGFRRGFY